MGIIRTIADLFAPRASYAKKRIQPTLQTQPQNESVHLEREHAARKQATALKKQKRYLEAIKYLRIARAEQYATSCQYDVSTLLRIPKYLSMAKQYQEALVECKDILNGKWPFEVPNWESRNQQNRVLILETMSEIASMSGDAKLANEFADVAKNENEKICFIRLEEAKREFRNVYSETGFDLARISNDCGDPSCPCKNSHGMIVSVFGNVDGFKRIEDLDIKHIFGGEIGHRLEIVDEYADADEIARQLLKNPSAAKGLP